MYYDHEPAGKRKMKIIKDALDRVSERLGRKLRILDVGCGDGHLSAFMSSLGHDVTAIDLDNTSIATAKNIYKNERVNFLQCDLEKVNEIFDVVTAFEVSEHVPEVHKFIKELRNHLIEGGMLLMSVPNGWSCEEMTRRFLLRNRLGRKIKSWIRSGGVLPRSNSQTHADSPHVHFFQYSAWKKLFEKNNFKFWCSWNVSLFFKQVYYMGMRKFLKPSGLFFKFLDKIDSGIVNLFPSWMADGWVMTFKK